VLAGPVAAAAAVVVVLVGVLLDLWPAIPASITN